MGTEAAIMGGSALLGLMNRPDTIAAPPSRSYLGEMTSALDAQGGIQQRLIGMESMYGPQWQRQNQSMISSQMGLMNQLYGQAQGFASTASNQAIDVASPLYGRIGQAAMRGYEGMMGGSANLMNTLEQQAAEELSLGRGLSAEEQRYGEQAARSAYGARGITQGNQAIASEVLSNNSLGQAREQQRRLFAGNVIAGRQGMVNSAYSSFAQPLMGQIQALSPAGMIAQSQSMNQGLGAKLFNPESQYNADVMGANNQNMMSTNLANAQISAGYGTGMMSMLGSMAGGALQNKNFFKT